jgi:hypothetical protein
MPPADERSLRSFHPRPGGAAKGRKARFGLDGVPDRPELRPENNVLSLKSGLSVQCMVPVVRKSPAGCPFASGTIMVFLPVAVTSKLPSCRVVTWVTPVMT